MITIKTPEEIEIMRAAGLILAEVFRILLEETGIGVKTIDLDKLARETIRGARAEPAFLNYRPAGSRSAYPFTLCASLNDCVVHGQPSDYRLREGDILKLDLGLKYKGFYVDSAVTVGVGKISKEANKLIRVTEEALSRGIEECRAGKTIGDIGYAIERHVLKNNFSIVKSLVGHGIGKSLHEPPEVLNFGERGEREELLPGMVLAIEPMVAMGSGATRVLKDDSFVTADGSLSAHWEHTVAITEHGPIILTK